jgi:hypothetical protein
VLALTPCHLRQLFRFWDLWHSLNHCQFSAFSNFYTWYGYIPFSSRVEYHREKEEEETRSSDHRYSIRHKLMMRVALTILTLTLLVLNTAFALILPPSRHAASRNHYDFFQPHFEVPTTTNKPTTDQMVECAEQGECTVEEMDLMIQGMKYER